MRRTSLIAVAISLLFITSFKQQTSQSVDKDLSEVERLFYTCKIWGFLKYYHPLAGKGAFDWDEKLKGALDNTKNIQTYEEYSTYMARWIYYLGPTDKGRSSQSDPSKAFLKNFDLSWTQSNLFSDDLKANLKRIENDRFQGDHYYIGRGKIGDFEPKNEKLDFDFNWKDEQQRLLLLFRYWNFVEYFYPYKYLTDQSWDDALKELIPVFQQVETKLEFHQALLQMVVKVDDSHATFSSNEISEMPYFNYLPAGFEVVENQVVVTEILDEAKARANDLQIGDIIVSVNSQPALALHESHKKFMWGSNDAAKDRNIYLTLFMGIQNSAEVTIMRDGSKRTENLTLYKSHELTFAKKSEEKWETLRDSIGYVNMGRISTADVGPMMEELMEKRAIIFDIRNNPRGTYKAVAKYLRPSDTTFAKLAKPDFSYPGKFKWDGKGTCGEQNDDYYQGIVLLLVNERTQNHAEYTCMCLQTAPRVFTVGSQTAGANGQVTKFRLLTRAQSSITGMGVFYPDGSEVQRNGVKLDFEVKPTIAGVQSGTDEILERAIHIAEEEMAKDDLIKMELARQARLDSLARIDSLAVDSLMINPIQVDTLEIGDGQSPE